LKATFDFSIEVPESYTVLSNQPEKESKGLGNGLKKVSFVTAPKMSTYVSFIESVYSHLLTKLNSFMRGLAGSSSTLKPSPSASMKAEENYLSECIRPKVSPSRVGSRWKTRGKL
jgi:hypothetical protein